MSERILVWLLRIGGVATGSAFFAVFLPTEVMRSIHGWLGLGMFPDSAIVQYLARSISAMYGFHGVLLLIISGDLRRYRPVVIYAGVFSIIFGVLMLGIDLAAGMPSYWTWGEGPLLMVLGVVVLLLLSNIPSTVGEELARKSGSRVFETRRLWLVPGSIEFLEACVAGREMLQRTLGIRVPESWPPELFDDEAVSWVLKRLRQDPRFLQWGLRYLIQADLQRPVLVGIAGYKGPPDESGSVEIGYAILPEFQRQGFASEAAAGLIESAFESPGVERVVAETFPHLKASIRVMERAGMTFEGPGSEEGTIRYEIRREQWQGGGSSSG